MKSVKGALLADVVQELRERVEQGKLGREALEARLEAQDLAILDGKLLLGAWYPVDAMGRIFDVLWAETAPRQPEGPRERGRSTARQLAESGIYRQVEVSRSRQGKEFGRILTSLAGTMFNFMRWEYESQDGGRTSRVIVSEAADWPEVMRFACEGFIETLVSASGGHPVRVTSQRPTPDRVVFDIRAAR